MLKITDYGVPKPVLDFGLPWSAHKSFSEYPDGFGFLSATVLTTKSTTIQLIPFQTYFKLTSNWE